MYEITLTYGGTVSISSLFIVTWDQVGYAPNGFDQVSTQLLFVVGGLEESVNMKQYVTKTMTSNVHTYMYTGEFYG